MINWTNHDWYNVLSNGTCPNRFIELRDIMYNFTLGTLEQFGESRTSQIRGNELDKVSELYEPVWTCSVAEDIVPIVVDPIDHLA